jgi:hypothetical protein
MDQHHFLSRFVTKKNILLTLTIEMQELVT